MAIPEALNLDFLEEQHRRYQSDPASVSRQWQDFFQGFEIGLSRSDPGTVDTCDPQAGHVAELIHRFRDLGHLLACMDPLNACPTSHPLLEPTGMGLGDLPPDTTVATPQFSFSNQMSLQQLIGHLKQTYCRAIGVEYMHLQDPQERKWLQDRMEPEANKTDQTAEQRQRILKKLTQAALFEQFLNKKYPAVTRFSLEGGDGIIPMLDGLMTHLHQLSAEEVVLGMAHRGRLNVQANILHRPKAEIFAEFEHCHDSGQLVGAGDVKYHNGYLGHIAVDGDDTLTAFLVNNPSHLEAVCPVVEGIARARQEMTGDHDRRGVVPILIHGDAAFAGQGIVAETLNMSQLRGYTTGGTIHIVINNQIGYTTTPRDARSTRYSTDVAKMLMVPIFHVHGENPEALIHVIRLAAEYRYAFGKDVVLDVVCYRRYGHNEGDEPYFTQPLMYDRIRQRPSLHQLYAEDLIQSGVIRKEHLAAMETEIAGELEAAYQEVRGTTCAFPQPEYFPQWARRYGSYSHEPVSTAVPVAQLKRLAQQINTLPKGYAAHRKISTLLHRRQDAVLKGKGIDWANAESLAFTTLLSESIGIRLSGQDSARGTFSQRHSIIFHGETGEPYTPLDHLEPPAAPIQIYNSLLAEAGVLGFEYGYSIADPDTLTLWEAQFGDFLNNAQAIVDLFIAAGETKWQRLCGLTLLLPHGWEGLGPEHSSARLERFLQLCADDNIQVCDVTTPAQYFHLLRRQAKAPFRKPLVIMTPKSLLRHPQAVSTLKEFSDGVFQPILDDPIKPYSARKVLLCSGKIYYQLLRRREELKAENPAIIRLEQLYPLAEDHLKTVLAGYSKAKEYVWAQEAPQNMGAWHFMRPRIQELIKSPLTYVGRLPAASPATGFPTIYKQEQDAISDEAVGALVSDITNMQNDDK